MPSQKNIKPSRIERVELNKEFILKSLLPKEKTALKNGLKLFNLSFNGFLNGGYALIDENKGFDILKIPSAPITKKFSNRKLIIKKDLVIRNEFWLVLRKIIFITFQTLIDKNQNAHAFEYGVFVLDAVNKMKGRFPEEDLSILDGLIQQISNDLIKLEIIISNTAKQRGKSKNAYYKPKRKIPLVKLSESLIKAGLIEDGDRFLDSFQAFEFTKKNKVVWLGQQRQLIYLYYLIFDGTLYKRETIFEIVVKTFVNKNNKEYSIKGLNTAYAQICSDINKPNKLSKNLELIKTIFNSPS